MNFRAILLATATLVVFSGVSSAAPPRTEASEMEMSPYAKIGERNIFHLNPTPVPPPPENPPPPNIKITGIIKSDTALKALFAIPGKEAKDLTTYLCLAEGQSEGPVELLKIFPDKEECDVVNAGIKMTLSFKNNSFIPTPARVIPPLLPR